MNTNVAFRGFDSPYASSRHVDSPAGCYFYHVMDLPEFGLQSAPWDLREQFGEYIGNVDVGGRRVLDVGTASGFLSFEAEKRGAREVVSFDLDSAERQHLLPFAGSEYVENHKSWCAKQTEVFMTWQRGYWLTHRLLKSKNKVVYGNVYDPPSAIGMFDVVIVGAILEHLIDPLSALRAIARHAGDLIVINTDFVESDEMIARFNGRLHMPANSYVFWTYSIPIYDEYMKIMGFEPVRALKERFLGGNIRQLRAALVYRRKR